MIPGSRFRLSGFGSRVSGLGFRTGASEVRISVSDFGFGFQLFNGQGSMLRVEGSK